MKMIYCRSMAVAAVTFGTISCAGNITPATPDENHASAQDAATPNERESKGENVNSTASASATKPYDDSHIAKEFERLRADGKHEKAARLLMKQWDESGLSGPLRMKLLETQKTLGWKTKALQTIVSIYIYDPKPEYLATTAFMAYQIGDRDFAESLAISLLSNSVANVGVKRDMAYMMVQLNIDRLDVVSTERYLELLQEYSGGDEEDIPMYKAILLTVKGNYEEAIRNLDMAAKNVGGPTDDLPHFTEETFGVLRDRPEYWTAVKIIVERTEHERKQREYLYAAIRNAMKKAEIKQAETEESDRTPQ